MTLKTFWISFALTCFLLTSGCSPGDKTGVEMKELGIVATVSDCHGDRCHVVTDIYDIPDMNVSVYPEGKVEVGETLSFRKNWYERQYTTAFCRNENCRQNFVCKRRMACWRASTKAQTVDDIIGNAPVTSISSH